MGEVRAIHEIIRDVIPHYKKKGGPDAEHKLSYQSFAETLEPVYYFILDFMDELGLEKEKLVDTFTDTPGGAHFSETGLKMQRMQEEASKMMANIGIVLRSVLNIVYDLKEFKIRLKYYDDSRSGKKTTKEAAILALKQIWMDKVDMNKGNSSIKAMALGQAGFQTLIDAFLAAEKPEDSDKLDLNDRVKRILKPRLQEFYIWLKESEKELRKRYSLEKTHLKSQVNNLKLYSRWVKPYMLAAKDLEKKDQRRNPNIVGAFDNIILELTIIGKSKLDVQSAALDGVIPRDLEKMRLKKDYYSCSLVDFNFRTVPKQGNYIGKFLGRVDVTFRAYALSADELKKIDEEIDKSDLGDVFSLIEGTTTESIEKMEEEINMFLDETDPDSEEEEPEDDSNPFKALIGLYGKKEDKKEKSSGSKKSPVFVKEDDWIEKTHLRPAATETAISKTFLLFNVYKKAHGMLNFDPFPAI